MIIIKTLIKIASINPSIQISTNQRPMSMTGTINLDKKINYQPYNNFKKQHYYLSKMHINKIMHT